MSAEIRLGPPFYDSRILDRHFPGEQRDGFVSIDRERLKDPKVWEAITTALNESLDKRTDETDPAR